MATTIQRSVRVTREPGGHAAVCNCGWRAVAPAVGAAVAALIRHVGDEHPNFVPRLLEAFDPPAEYVDDPIPPDRFDALMKAWWAIPDSRTDAAPGPPAQPRRRRKVAQP